MATASNEQPRRKRPLPRRLILGPIHASRGLGRATVKLIRSIGRIHVPASKQTRALGKEDSGPGRLRTLRNRSVAAIRRSITITRGLPARGARKITRRAGRAGDLAGAIPPGGQTAERRGKAGERATPPTEQAQIEAKPAEPKARAVTRRTRQRRATSQQGKPRQARPTQVLEQYTVRELREQARKAGIERSSSMTKGQLIKALEPSPTDAQAQTGPYEERTVEELRERAAELGIKGRSSMTKEQLIKALRDHR
jgi:Rho termination factor, N-terminal domain